MEDIIEVDDGNNGNGNTNGRLVLRRKFNTTLDREETAYYDGVETDVLKYTLIVFDTDKTNNKTIDVIISY